MGFTLLPRVRSCNLSGISQCGIFLSGVETSHISSICAYNTQVLDESEHGEEHCFREKWLFLLFALTELDWGEISLHILLLFILSEA